jgi:hypothetical protein
MVSPAFGKRSTYLFNLHSTVNMIEVQYEIIFKLRDYIRHEGAHNNNMD